VCVCVLLLGHSTQSQSASLAASLNNSEDVSCVTRRYVRLNGPLENEKMDDATLMESWVAAAEAWCEVPANREAIEVLAARLVSAV